MEKNTDTVAQDCSNEQQSIHILRKKEDKTSFTDINVCLFMQIVPLLSCFVIYVHVIGRRVLSGLQGFL